jgi:hypothetical protein
VKHFRRSLLVEPIEINIWGINLVRLKVAHSMNPRKFILQILLGHDILTHLCVSAYVVSDRRCR